MKLTHLSLFALILVACTPVPQAAPTAPAAPSLELKIYEVPDAYRAEARGVIRSLLHRGKNAPTLGSVALGPGGQLLVTAPSSVHSGVAQFVEKLRSQKPKPPASVSLDYWVLLGTRAEAPSEVGDLDPALAPALSAIQKSHGPMKFHVGERLSLSSISGESAEAAGAHVRVHQTATAYEDRILARLSIKPGSHNSFETRVQFPSSKMVVLGHAGLEESMVRRMTGEEGGDYTAYYVVRGTLAQH